MSRHILSEDRIHPAIREKISANHRDIVEEVQAAIAAHDVVVVGMKQNPHPRRARKALSAKGIDFKYLEYGSYFSQWKERLAIKLWAGFPTFPMVFLNGTLEGGFSELKKLRDEGKLK